MPGRLVLCATPIGNLGDASPRLGEALAGADVVYAEDTRRAAVLLSHLGVTARLRSFFAGNESDAAERLAADLVGGKVVALVTDAGTPGVSDPGLGAVAAARRAGAEVSVVPGPSAVTAAVAVSGMVGDRFCFEGFLPRRGGERARRLEAIAGEERPTVVFLSPHRARADLADLAEVAGTERTVCVVREVTKVHEEVWWGTLGGATAEWTARQPRGEFTVVVAGAPAPAPDIDAAMEAARALVAAGSSPSQAAREAARRHGADRRAVYEALLR